MKGTMVEKNKCFISTVVYLHNRGIVELEQFCDKIVRKLSDNFENNEVIFVCDGHGIINEGTINDTLKKLDLNIMAETVQMAYYQGIEAAMCAGDDLAIGDFVFEFDTIDVDYEEELPMKVFHRAREGFDIVSAGDDSMSFGSRIFYKLINHRSSYEVRHESFRVVSRRALNRVKILNNTIPYRKILYAACGLPTDYIKYEPSQTTKKYKKNQKENAYRFNAGINFMMIFTKLAEKFTFALSGLFLLMTIGTGCWALYSHLVEDNVAGGWASLMTVMSLGFFGVFMLISILVKYMSLILDMNYKKSSYVVESVNKNLK